MEFSASLVAAPPHPPQLQPGFDQIDPPGAIRRTFTQYIYLRAKIPVYNIQRIKEDIREEASLQMIYNIGNPGFNHSAGIKVVF